MRPLEEISTDLENIIDEISDHADICVEELASKGEMLRKVNRLIQNAVQKIQSLR